MVADGGKSPMRTFTRSPLPLIPHTHSPQKLPGRSQLWTAAAEIKLITRPFLHIIIVVSGSNDLLKTGMKKVDPCIVEAFAVDELRKSVRGAG